MQFIHITGKVMHANKMNKELDAFVKQILPVIKSSNKWSVGDLLHAVTTLTNNDFSAAFLADIESHIDLDIYKVRYKQTKNTNFYIVRVIKRGYKPMTD